MSGLAPIRFHFDYLSPYAYLAWTQMARIGGAHQREIDPIPVLFAALLAHHGTRGPAEVPARRRYLIKDVARLAHQFGVTIDAPPSHPFNPLLALRLTSLDMPADQRRALIDALFAAAWRERREISEPEVVAAIAQGVGIGPDRLEEANGEAAKVRLRAQTDAAIAFGIFGVPSMVVDGELFWGCDSLPHLERFLTGNDPVPADFTARWAHLKPSAQRR